MAPTSRLLAWVAVAGVLPALLLVATPGAWPLVAALWTALAAAAAFDAWRAPGRLAAVTIQMPSLVRLTHERPGSVPLRVAPLRTPLGTPLDLRVAPLLPADLDDGAAPATVRLSGADVPVEIACLPRRRGSFRIASCRLESASPWGLWVARGARTVDCEVRAYPNLLSERRHVPALFLYRGRGGAHRQRQIGKGREFEKLREYLPGDSFEDVHWKATARRGRPVTKLFQVERTQEVYVVLDSSRLSARPSGNPAQPALERTVRAALVLALAAERQGDLFGLVTFGDRVRNFVGARTGPAHFLACREALYALDSQSSSPDFDELATFLRTRLRRRALLVVLTDLDDPLLAESFQRAADLLRRQHLLLVCTPRPSDVAPVFSRPADDVGEVYRQLAGHLRWQDQRELGRALEQKGVGYALLGAETLAAEVVSRYAAIKQRQSL